MPQRAIALPSGDRPRYLEPIVPVVFPVEAEVPESQLHLELRTLLYQLLSDYLGLERTVGSDQFVYFDAADPKQSLAPDVYVSLKPRGDQSHRAIIGIRFSLGRRAGRGTRIGVANCRRDRCAHLDSR